MRQMSESYPATAKAVGSARHAVSAFATALGADSRMVQSIALAVGEACANVAVHAYRESSGPGEMTVSAGLVDEELRVKVVDDGVGMVPRIDSPGIGMGLSLMSQLSDTLETRTSPGSGTEVCMHFRLR